jgi:hypothetical protein
MIDNSRKDSKPPDILASTKIARTMIHRVPLVGKSPMNDLPNGPKTS